MFVMCACIHICMSVYLCVYVRVYVRVYVYMCMCMFVLISGSGSARKKFPAEIIEHAWLTHVRVSKYIDEYITR